MLDYKAEIFIRTAELLNISRAAREMNISQPAATAAVQKLEEQFGVKLFLRQPRGLVLTGAGKLLFQHLKELKNRAVLIQNEMMQIQGKIHGCLQLGASPTVGDYLLPRLLGPFSRQHPEVSYTLQSGNNQYICRQLKEGNLELAFLAGRLPGKRLNTVRVMEDELVLIVSPRHPWSCRGTVAKEELPEQPLILRERGSASRRDMEETLAEIGLPLDELIVIAEFYSLEAIKAAVESDLGAALISKWAITKELKTKSLQALRINGVRLRRHIHAVTSAHHVPTEAASRFMQFAAEEMKRASLNNHC